MSSFRRPLRALALSCVWLAACDPSATDSAYWERDPALQPAASSGEVPSGDDASTSGGASTPGGDGTSGGHVSTSGGAVASGACLRVRVTTESYRGEYAPENVGALWLSEVGGGFVRTLEVWGNKRLEHAVGWRAESGSNRVDAITSATRRTHGEHLLVWNCKDATGALRQSGRFALHAEFTEANSNEGDAKGPRALVEFELGQAQSVPVADGNGYRGWSVEVLAP